MATIDHSNCGHERTPKARAKCRADRKKAGVVTTPTPAAPTPALVELARYEAAVAPAVPAERFEIATMATERADFAEVLTGIEDREIKTYNADRARIRAEVELNIIKDLVADPTIDPSARAKANEMLAIREGIEGRPSCGTCGNFRYDDAVTDVTSDGSCGPDHCSFAGTN